MSLLARLLSAATLASAALLAACGGGGGGGGGGGNPIFTDAGFLKLALTDATACGYNQVNLTLQKVRVHPSATAADGDSGWSEVVPSPTPRIDLLSLTNGAVLELGQVTLPVGTYRQMSVVLAPNDATAPLANSVVPVGSSESALGLPANPQFKIAIAVDVVKNQTSDYVIDFDACNSVLRFGTSGNYSLSPRYSIVQRVSATGQRITGYVDTALDPRTTRISAQQNGAIVRSTVPDANGLFILYPLTSGSYDLVISALGAVPTVVTGVPASDNASTDINNQGTRISPTPSTPHTATGTVNTGTTPVDARVTVVKMYTGGPNVVVAGAPADASNGELRYTLPSGAAARAPYVAGVPPAFSADPAVPTGVYTIAVTAGTVTRTAVVDASHGDPAPVSFTFP